MLILSCLPVFSFILSVFCILFKKSLSALKSWRCSPMLSFGSFIVLVFIIRSIIYLKLMVYYRPQDSFFFPLGTSSWPSTIQWKAHPLPYRAIVEKQGPCVCVGWVAILDSDSVFSSWVGSSHCACHTVFHSWHNGTHQKWSVGISWLMVRSELAFSARVCEIPRFRLKEKVLRFDFREDLPWQLDYISSTGPNMVLDKSYWPQS